MNNSIISSDAKLGENVKIGPFCYIEGDVEIGEGTIIEPNVTIYEHVKIGKNCHIFPGAVIGAVPQDLKFDGEISYVEIGDNTTIRECATINRGTASSGKILTKVGNNVLVMSYVHIAHDCVVGDNCILVSYVGLAGETEVDEWAIIGGGAVVHQFSKIGAHAMIGGASAVTKDVPPYALAAGNLFSYEGVNVVGLRRRGFSVDEIEGIRSIYRVIYQSALNTTAACNKIEAEFPETPYKRAILDFIKESKRGIVKHSR